MSVVIGCCEPVKMLLSRPNRGVSAVVFLLSRRYAVLTGFVNSGLSEPEEEKQQLNRFILG